MNPGKGAARPRRHRCQPVGIRGATFRRALLTWFRKHGRDLPWRRTRDPYAILVSEFMLQQTQVATVLPYYAKWMRRFPTFSALAAADEADVLHAWQGLGYYTRARNLRAAAGLVQNRHRGVLPDEPALLRQLPGIGRYSANAVAAFAFDKSVPIVEANSGRVLSRLFNVSAREQLWEKAAHLLPKRHARNFNSALIDLGALLCTARNPKCSSCPVKVFCRAPALQIRRPRPPTQHLREDHLFVHDRARVLLERCRTRWSGMWMLPRRQLDGLKPSSCSTGEIAYCAVFPFTHHRVTLRVFRARRRRVAHQDERWFPRASLDSVPMPSPHRRALDALLT